MKSILLATVASLALTGAGFAQSDATTTPPVVTPDPAASAAETAADNAVDAAKEAAKEAEKAVGEAVKAADEAVTDATKAAGDAASDAATAAEAAASDAAKAADKAATEAAKTADEVATDAADKADKAADAAAEAASDAADSAAAAASQAVDDAEKAASESLAAAEKAVEKVAPPDVKAPAISAEEPGVLSSWITSRHVWTTNQPSTTEWTDPQLTERPAEWQDIAKISDIVLDDSENTVGYIADIGGFLGIGAKKVLLGRDAIHLVTIGNDSFYATNFTKEELQALPDFNEATVRK